MVLENVVNEVPVDRVGGDDDVGFGALQHSRQGFAELAHGIHLSPEQSGVIENRENGGPDHRGEPDQSLVSLLEQGVEGAIRRLEQIDDFHFSVIGDNLYGFANIAGGGVMAVSKTGGQD